MAEEKVEGVLGIPYSCQLEAGMYCLIEDVARKWELSFDQAVQALIHLGARVYEGAGPGQSVFVANSDGSDPLLEAGRFPTGPGQATVFRVNTNLRRT